MTPTISIQAFSGHVQGEDWAGAFDAFSEWLLDNSKPGDIYDLRGTYKVSRPVQLYALDVTFLCGTLICAEGFIDDEVLVLDCPGSSFRGRLRVDAALRAPLGVVFGNCYLSQFESIVVERARRWGLSIRTGGNLVQADLGTVAVRLCGDREAFVEDVVAWENFGAPQDVGQTSHVEFTSGISYPPGDLFYSDRMHYVTHHDIPGKTVLFPHYEGDPDNILNLYSGGGISLDSSNTAGLTFRLSAQNCPIACQLATLYGPTIESLVAENCDVVLQLGRNGSGLMTSGSVGYFHGEGSVWDIVNLHRAEIQFKIITGRVDASKCIGVTTARDRDLWLLFDGIELPDGMKREVSQLDKNNQIGQPKVGNHPRWNGPHQFSGPLLRIGLIWNRDANRLYGYDTATMNITDCSRVTFFVHQGGGTIEGADPDTGELSIDLNVAPWVLKATFDYYSNAWRIIAEPQ